MRRARFAVAIALLALACMAGIRRPIELPRSLEDVSVTQYRSGLLRIENGSTTAFGSWTAKIPADSEQEFLDGEELSFSPSGATGYFLSLDEVAREFRFFRSSGTPADGDQVTGASSGEEIVISSPEPDADFSDVGVKPLLIEGHNADVLIHGTGLVLPGSLEDKLALLSGGTDYAWPHATIHGVRYALALDLSERVRTFDADSARLILPGAGDILLPQALRWNAMVLERTLNRMQVRNATNGLQVQGKASGVLYVLQPTAMASATMTIPPADDGGQEVGQVFHFKNRHATNNLSIACGSGVQIDDSSSTIVLGPGDALTLVHVATDRWYTLTAYQP